MVGTTPRRRCYGVEARLELIALTRQGRLWNRFGPVQRLCECEPRESTHPQCPAENDEANAKEGGPRPEIAQSGAARWPPQIPTRLGLERNGCWLQLQGPPQDLPQH